MDLTTQISTLDLGADSGASTAGQLQHSAYDSIEPKGKRRQPPAVIMREDQHLKGRRRLQMMANAADLRRNLSIAAWMIRRHLDYCANFSYQPSTGDRGFDRELRDLMAEQSRPANMDRGRRLNREKFFRLLEARRVIDGDSGSIRLRSGQLQFIKGDLIADPPESRRIATNRGDWESGVLADAAGAPIAYGIYGRANNGRGREYRRTIAAQRFLHYGFFDDSAADQTRGISPFAQAINDLRDVYESIDYAKVKVKLSQLLGVKFTRNHDAAPITAGVMDNGSTDELEDDEQTDEREAIDWTNGIATFDMEEGEDVSLLESATPATQTVDFIKLVILVGMKALDLPYSFFDEKHTNFHSTRGAWIQYERSCLPKRDDQVEARNTWTLWTYQNWVNDGRLVLPSSISNVSQIRHRWIPKGLPWWKPSEEVKASIDAIGAGFDNPERVCNEFDRGDVFENIDKTLEVMAYAAEQGERIIGRPYSLAFDLAAQTTASPAATGSEPDDEQNEENEGIDDE